MLFFYMFHIVCDFFAGANGWNYISILYTITNRVRQEKNLMQRAFTVQAYFHNLKNTSTNTRYLSSHVWCPLVRRKYAQFRWYNRSLQTDDGGGRISSVATLLCLIWHLTVSTAVGYPVDAVPIRRSSGTYRTGQGTIRLRLLITIPMALQDSSRKHEQDRTVQ